MNDKEIVLLADVVRAEAISILTHPRTAADCRKCGEMVRSDHKFKLVRLIDPYGDDLGVVDVQHCDCDHPTLNTNEVRLDRNLSRNGLETELQGELMKDGPSMQLPEDDGNKRAITRYMEKGST